MSAAQKKPARARKRKVTLHVVSDATGNLASHMIHAVITQFPQVEFTLKYHVFQKGPEQLTSTLKALRGANHLVLHALLDPEMKRLTHEICRTKQLDDFDLTGSLVQFIADHTTCSPANELARLHHTDEGYFRRIRAMEFTAQHDDNRRLETISEADIVIVGLSRVSKSPTSTWLGSKGYKVANVALAIETGFPDVLESVREKTVAFTARPKDLYETRKRRFEQFTDAIQSQDLSELPYTDLRAVVHEVAWAESQYRKRKYPIVDITRQTVEELAVKVLTVLKLDVDDMLYPR